MKAPLANSRINWVYDSPPSQSHHIAPRQTPPKSKTNIVTNKSHTKEPRTNNIVPKSNNKVLRNNDNVPRNRPIAQSSDVRMRAPLGNISRSVWHNSTLSFRFNKCPPVPRNNMTDRQIDPQKTVSPTPKRKRNRYYRRERRAIERAERGEMFIHDAQWATQSSGAPSSTLVPDRLTESGLLHSDPISAMLPAVYPPVTLEGRQQPMIIRPSILTRSLVNRPAYSQAYINRPFQTLFPNPQQEAERLAISFADRTSSDNLPISVRLKQQQLEQRRWQEIEHACSLQDDTDIPYTLEELQAAHKKGKDTAPGADNITYTMIANLGTPGELILLKLINKTHTHRTRPSTWNEQDTQPIPKPKDPENPRPIALVSCLEKIAEKMVLNRLKYKTGPLHPQLYAYTDGIGTTECINDVLHCVDGKPANIVFIDFEKAFELASPAAILHSLARKGVKGHLLAWNKNYVKNRKARVRFQGHTSEFKDLENGTPQGGILSPFLFNILMEHIACLRLPNGVYIFIYADDVCAVARGVHKFHNMQKALNMIFETSSEIGLKINIQKTKAMAIRHTNTERNFKIGQQQLEWVNSFMYLGVHIDCELKFNTEIKYLRERANARLSTMKYMTSLKEGASYRVQHAYYLACTRTLIDYAAPTLTNMTQTQKASLEVIQNNAMRLMLGAPMWTRQCNLRAETNLPSLEHRIEQRNISITAKMLGSERDSQTQRRMRDELPKNPDIHRPNTHSKHLGNIVRKCKMKNILLDIKQATHTVNPIPPWENDLANYNYTQLDKPKEQCTLQELKTAAELSISLSENPNCSVYYTDGSVDPATNTAGAAVYSDTYTASWRTSDTSSTLQTELVAIHKTLQYSINHGHTNVTIHTDSKSALLTLQRTKQKENTHLIYDIKTFLLQHKTAGRKVTLNWIPSHIGIPGNDKADELAGTTKHIDRVQITMPLSILTIKNTLKQTNRTNIEKEVTHWANNNSRSAQWYTKATKFEPPPIYRDTPRHLAVTIHRLRLGYKANWEIDEPIIRPCEHCQTQTEYPLLHYLLQCPNTQSLRPHMQALDPANPEANRIAAGQVKDIMDNIETHIQTLTDFPPPR